MTLNDMRGSQFPRCTVTPRHRPHKGRAAVSFTNNEVERLLIGFVMEQVFGHTMWYRNLMYESDSQVHRSLGVVL